MFLSAKRPEREKQDPISTRDRLCEALLKGSAQGLFLLDAKGQIQPQVSASLAKLFRRQDFTDLSFEKLLGPLVAAKTLSAAKAFVARLLDSAQPIGKAPLNPLDEVEVRLANSDGSFGTAHYSFEFTALDADGEPRARLVWVTDITARVQQHRELEDLRMSMQTQGEVLRGVLQSGTARFDAFLNRTDAAMKAINEVLKKPAREADAFRNKLEQMLDQVDRVRREAAGLKLSSLAAPARLLEDALQELRSRDALSGSDFLPLAVKLDDLYGKFALLRALSAQPVPVDGTQVIEAPNFLAEIALAQKAALAKASAATTSATAASAATASAATASAAAAIFAASAVPPRAPAGGLESALTTLTEHVAQEHRKSVALDCSGAALVPPCYQATIKNVAFQLIRNAVTHGVESPAARQAGGKPAHATLRLEFRTAPDGSFEMHFQDDGRGLDPDRVRATAIAKGLLTLDAAAQLHDRQAIKLIFRSGFTTMSSAPGEAPHGNGMSLVRRYVQEAGGKIALATVPGRETRFKITLPAASADAQVA